jgi:hypothetical protein
LESLERAQKNAKCVTGSFACGAEIESPEPSARSTVVLISQPMTF